MTKTFFNPGCALSIYKPVMEDKIISYLNDHYQETTMHKICCQHEPQLSSGSLIINVCAGCDKRFRSLYEGITTISLWEIIDQLDTFILPNYDGYKMSLHDPCPVRERPEVHRAVRSILKKMNIEVVETARYGAKSVCCGDDLYPKLPVEKVHKLMEKRANGMPCEDVCVYCVSCIKSLYIGGKKPRHLIDLLMNETTDPQVYDTVKWHQQLQEYIDAH